MQAPVSGHSPTGEEGLESTRISRLSRLIEHASHLLPAQGPITVFIHHNTLHAFEDLPFTEAVETASTIYGFQPYLSEDRYRDALTRGRILFDTLHEVLEHSLGEGAGEPIAPFGTRLDLRLAMLQYPLQTGPTEELVWYVAEVDALRRARAEVSSADRARMIAETRRWVIRDLRVGAQASLNGSTNGNSARKIPSSLGELLDRFGETTIESWNDENWERFTLQALWRVCCDGVRDLPPFTTRPPLEVRHRDLLLEATGVDTDSLVQELMIRFCAAFLDQGFAHWPLPGREEGFYRCFLSLYRRPWGPPEQWMKGLAEELGRLQDDGIGPLESILESLDLLGVAEAEWENFLSATLLALRGWGGMVNQVEMRGDRAVHPVPQGSFVEFLAVRLVLDRFALSYTARTSLGITSPVSAFWRLARGEIDHSWPPSVEQRAFVVFQLAQVFGLSPEVLHRLDKAEWRTLVREIETFSNLSRRRIFHLAYEQRFRTQTLDAVALHAGHTDGRPEAPAFQVVCCIDEREESFRRNLEEVAPSAETFGAAGFYNVAIYYRGVGDAHFVALCPIVIQPQQWVTEEVGEEHDAIYRRRARTRKAIGTASHQFHVGTRTFALGALLTGALGVLASFPLVARILFPRVTARIRHVFGRIVQKPPVTHLRLERADAQASCENGGIGFSLEEMTANGERLLRDLGLTSGFARLVILIGHGSNSLNNPHNSAYNCGACGGAAGGPNARAMAQILNDPRVRTRLAERGLTLPDDTVFVGAYHNTCDDSVIYFDLGRLPSSHRDDLESAREQIARTSERNAHERCRRFMSASLAMSYASALEHVEERSEDLAQTRPELGHATNAITIVGRREWSRGLFLDRRAFLTSYDPTQDDDDSTILTRVLQAVIPVCAGINLEYYFSHVDNNGYGAGTKLPHNLAALLGVMDGAASDLRTGLPWQMVEIHEPVRSLFIIETTAEAMLGIIDRNPGIGKMCRNGWIQVSVIHPETREISVYRDGQFRRYRTKATVLPRASSSAEWYRGWRDHLEFAEIVS